MAKKDPARVCEVPHMRTETGRKVYLEAFPNEDKNIVEQEAVRFDRGMREMFRRLGLGARHTESGIILPN